MGKHIVIVGANFSSVAIDSRQKVEITAIPTSINMVAGETALLEIETNVAATLIVTSLNTNIATVTDNGNNTYTINGIINGNATIKIEAIPVDTVTYKPTIKNIATIVVEA